MTYYTRDKFSSSEVAGAVAEAALHDLRVNLFTFSGFPQIHVAEPVEDIFKITLSWIDTKESSISIELSRSEAKSAAHKFQNKQGFDRAIFAKVQDALAKLEGKSRG